MEHTESERTRDLSPPLFRILNGFAKRGRVIELSGPPDSPKFPVVADLIRETILEGLGVVFVGMEQTMFKTRYTVSYYPEPLRYAEHGLS